MSHSQGALANMHGEKNRESVAGILLAHGFEEVGPVHVGKRLSPLEAFRVAREGRIEPLTRAFAVDVPVCIGVHDTKARADFLLWKSDWPEVLALMARTQTNKGSACDKMELVYANITERFPCRAIVLLDGSEYRPPYIRRARHWIEKSGGRVAQVFASLSEFRCWLTEGAEYPECSNVQTLFS